MARFNIIIAAWGDAYIECLAQIALPSLAPSAIEAKQLKIHSWKFIIYTTSCHVDQIKIVISRFFPFADQAYYEINPNSYVNHYLAMARAHHHGAEICVDEKARAIIVAPDAVFSSKILMRIAEVAGLGKQVLMAVGPRLSQETSLEILKNILVEESSISSRRLAALLMKHRHHEMMRYTWKSDNFSSEPYLLFWQNDNGWLLRSFHHHPLMIDFSDSRSLSVLKHDTIDGDFIGSFVYNWDRVHIVQDSDELLVCTLTPDDTFYSNKNDQNASVEFMRNFAYSNPLINPFHRWLITKPVKIHSDDVDGSWQEIEEDSANIVYQMLSNRPVEIGSATELPTLNLIHQIQPGRSADKWSFVKKVRRAAHAKFLRMNS